MYLKKTPNTHGRIRLSIVDNYYDKVKKCSRQKTVASIGWLDELEKQYDDPIAYFTKRVAQLNEEKQKKAAPDVDASMGGKVEKRSDTPCVSTLIVPKTGGLYKCKKWFLWAIA